MYNLLSNVVREKDYFLSLISSIKVHYDITITNIEPEKRGFYGETWKIYSDYQECYFIKIVFADYHKFIFKKNLPVVEYLYNSGIQYINKLIKTKDNMCSIDFHNGVLAVFEYIDGVNTHKYPLSQLFHALGKIYTIPAIHVDIEREDFKPELVDSFFQSFGSIPMVISAESQLLHYINRLKMFAKRCEQNMEDFYITHGDSGANVITNDNRFVIVDWDYPKLAPPERDAWVYITSKEDQSLFSKILLDYGINYTLQPDRIAYYCYYNYLYYFKENLFYLQSIQNQNALLYKKVTKTIEYLFFRGWSSKVLQQAETID